MKRLKRKATFFNAIHNKNEKYVEIYKNPDIDEFEECRHTNKYLAARVFVCYTGDVFAWDTEALHDEVVGQLNLGKGYNCDFTNNTFEITIRAMYDLKETQETLKNAFLGAKGIFDSLDISGCDISWDSYLDLHDVDDTFLNNLKTLNDIYDMEIVQE